MAQPYKHTLKKKERYFNALVVQDGLKAGEAPKDGDWESRYNCTGGRGSCRNGGGKGDWHVTERGAQDIFRVPIKVCESPTSEQ